VLSVCLCVCVCADLNTSHSVSMLDTIRTASLCIKLSATCKDPATSRKKFSSGGKGCGSVEMNGHSLPRIEEWKDKETLNDDDKDDDDDDDDNEYDEVDEDDNTSTISFKDLFRMATLGGATGNGHCRYQTS